MIVEGKSGVGIAAFSDTKSNELMWTHYAANSTGVCIEYRPRALLVALPPEATLVRVSYDERPVPITTADTQDTTQAVKKVLSQKKFNWAYEKEWRLLSRIGEVEIIGSNVIRRIYFGTRTSEIHKQRIRSELASSKIKLYQMFVDGYRYRHEKWT